MITRCFVKVAGTIVPAFVDHLPIFSCHMDWNRKWNSPKRDTACVLLRTANTTYKLYTANFLVGKQFEYNTNDSLRSTPWLQCHSSASDHDFYWKKKVCKQNQQLNRCVLLAHRHKTHDIIIAGALVRACRPRDAVRYTNRLHFGPNWLVHLIVSWVEFARRVEKDWEIQWEFKKDWESVKKMWKVVDNFFKTFQSVLLEVHLVHHRFLLWHWYWHTHPKNQ